VNHGVTAAPGNYPNIPLADWCAMGTMQAVFPLRLNRFCLPALFAGAVGVAAYGADPTPAREKLNKGAYAEVFEAAKKEGDGAALPWVMLRAEALVAMGRTAEARDFLVKMGKRFPLDLPLRLMIYETAKRTGAQKQATDALNEMDRLGGSREWAYRAPEERVALGRVALLVGGDPKRVLDLFYDPLRKEKPDFPGSYIATGQLALAKNDFALAARTFNTATQKFPQEAEAWFGLARAFAPSDTAQSVAALEKVFALNPNHTGAHLLRAEHHLDAERYGEAAAELQTVLKTNPTSPEAHALRAVLANLRGDPAGEKAARDEALKPWGANPVVPHLMGRKLSQKYRFAEGAALQREALKFDGGYLPAKSQLANDLLRLGEDGEGWKLAEEVQKADPYDVVAYNLTTLRDAIAHFQTLNSEHFAVRMDPKEAEVYGAEVLALLERAHNTLTWKYGLDLKQKTIVEIFPDQKDFAIRTFGLPGGAGYLGVCFGRVITANSAAARPGSNANWQAILWHEFCHVVTLTLTQNKMPRWLSEGISVYEERQQRGPGAGTPTGWWGEQMKPRYRAMIFNDEDFTPVSQLSAAFMRPKSPVHLGFAYYESSLVVEWLVQRWGLDKMKALLADLAQGKEINAALAANFAPIEQLDTEFAVHARMLATQVGPQADWTKPAPKEIATSQAAQKLLAEKPNNYDAILAYAEKLLGAKQWATAKQHLQKLLELYPDQRDPEGPYLMLARAQRELGEADAEVATLTKLADLTPEATDAFARLMEIHAARKAWPQVQDFSARARAVDPLKPEPYRYAADAAEATGDRVAAIAAYRTLLRLDPADPAEMHYRLARLLHADRQPEAKRQVLLALEEAPRFRAALQLLLEIAGQSAGPSEVNKPTVPANPQ